ncbi:hypothetical protein EVAR_19689_1 [Eumeta japonica]|uniref:Uncharacterized protein n=1 Tax=Eumeta variegata TaxID=151549 RepID=A0A4C1V3I1_EUMVA|nr:hypothetical protein EVAR_19689_1 [Eumeta japonica]
MKVLPCVACPPPAARTPPLAPGCQRLVGRDTSNNCPRKLPNTGLCVPTALPQRRMRELQILNEGLSKVTRFTLPWPYYVKVEIDCDSGIDLRVEIVRVLVPTFRLHHQTLKIVHGQSTSQDNSDKFKHNWDMLFYYGIPVPSFWLHHQISPIIPYYCNVLAAVFQSHTHVIDLALNRELVNGTVPLGNVTLIVIQRSTVRYSSRAVG